MRKAKYNKEIADEVGIRLFEAGQSTEREAISHELKNLHVAKRKDNFHEIRQRPA